MLSPGHRSCSASPGSKQATRSVGPAQPSQVRSRAARHSRTGRDAKVPRTAFWLYEAFPGGEELDGDVVAGLLVIGAQNSGQEGPGSGVLRIDQDFFGMS